MGGNSIRRNRKEEMGRGKGGGRGWKMEVIGVKGGMHGRSKE